MGVSLSGLAAAVANEGGVGVIATAMIGMKDPHRKMDPLGADSRALVDEIRKAHEKMVDGLLGVNIMCAVTNFKELVLTSLRERVDVIFSGAGLPLDLPKYLSEVSEELKERLRTKLVPIVSSGRAASILCRRWWGRFECLPDGFVVEGPKAGGHLGFKPEQIDDPRFSLETILADVIEAVRPFAERLGQQIPIIAAGGVYSGGDVARFIRMGASGVQMGTRFVATNECDADIAFKEAFVAAREKDITIIDSPVGLPGRALKNSFLDKVAEGMRSPRRCVFKCLHSCDEERAPYCIALALCNAYRGKLRHGFAFAGANVYLVDKIVSVKELFASLKQEFDAFWSREEEK